MSLQILERTASAPPERWKNAGHSQPAGLQALTFAHAQTPQRFSMHAQRAAAQPLTQNARKNRPAGATASGVAVAVARIMPSSDPAGVRTQDPILKRDVLYLLSYRIFFPSTLRLTRRKGTTFLANCNAPELQFAEKFELINTRIQLKAKQHACKKTSVAR